MVAFSPYDAVVLHVLVSQRRLTHLYALTGRRTKVLALIQNSLRVPLIDGTTRKTTKFHTARAIALFVRQHRTSLQEVVVP